ncbi:MAG: hypothetical protein PHS86_14595 [Syntrophaceae bacterium]|nr:hypothetical protein [Syntrophaceae bacterium]
MTKALHEDDPGVALKTELNAARIDSAKDTAISEDLSFIFDFGARKIATNRAPAHNKPEKTFARSPETTMTYGVRKVT